MEEQMYVQDENNDNDGGNGNIKENGSVLPFDIIIIFFHANYM